MCFVKCKKVKKVSREEKAKAKVRKTKALAEIYSKVSNAMFDGHYLNFKQYMK